MRVSDIQEVSVPSECTLAVAAGSRRAAPGARVWEAVTVRAAAAAPRAAGQPRSAAAATVGARCPRSAAPPAERFGLLYQWSHGSLDLYSVFEKGRDRPWGNWAMSPGGAKM